MNDIPLPKCTTMYLVNYWRSYCLHPSLGNYEWSCYKQVLCAHKCSALWGKCQGTCLLDHMARVCLVLWETAKLSSKVATSFVSFASPSAMSGSSCCSTALPAFGAVSSLDRGHFTWTLAASCCCFLLHFPAAIYAYTWQRTYCYVLIFHLCVFFSEVLVKIFGPSLSCLACNLFVCNWFLKVIYYLIGCLQILCLRLLLVLPGSVTEQTFSMNEVTINPATDYAFGSKNLSPNSGHLDFSPVFVSRNFSFVFYSHFRVKV